MMHGQTKIKITKYIFVQTHQICINSSLKTDQVGLYHFSPYTPSYIHRHNFTLCFAFLENVFAITLNISVI